MLLPRDGRGIPAHQRALYGLGVAFLTYGVTTLPPHGNGVIAVFVARSCSASAAPTSAHYFASRAEDIVEIVKLGVFVVFGSLLTFDGLFGDGWAAVGDRRRHAAGRAAGRDLGRARRHRPDSATKAFIAWFGPKGVATMTFSLLILAEPIPATSGSSTSPRSSCSARSSPTG